MRYRTFGRTGWKVSEIGFGAWAIGGSWGPQSETDSLDALARALDLGCNFIDTAQGYGDGKSEQIIGRFLKSRKPGGEHIYVATKIPPTPGGAWPPTPYDRIEDRYPEKYLRERLERSLRDLQMETIDLVQLHTWTRAWNRNPSALETMRKFQKEGKLRAVGVSTPEHDQNALIDLMRGGWLDSVQVIYNIFEQEPQAEFLPVAEEKNVGVIARMPFDESALTGKLTKDTKWEKGDFRNNYFAGDRLDRAVARVEKLKRDLGAEAPGLAEIALKFALKPNAVSTVIAGMRNPRQVEMNLAVSSQQPITDALEEKLHDHRWNRAFWYAGK
jgi:aryl-alcohol dehydrogenase-like predicted oxidoreductase